MRTIDLLRLGLSGLRRQKLRTFLTGLGVTVGIATLVASVSVGLGVRKIIEDGFRNERRLREITIYAGQGQSSNLLDGVPAEVLAPADVVPVERRERIKRELAREWRMRNAPPAEKPLVRSRLAEIAQWEHVVAVRPVMGESARARHNDKTQMVRVAGTIGDGESLAPALIVGRVPQPGSREVIVKEWMMFNYGVRTDAELSATLGKTIRLDFRAGSPAESLLHFLDADAARVAQDEIAAVEKFREHLPRAIDTLPMTDAERAALKRAIARKNPQKAVVKSEPVSWEMTIVGVARNSDPGRDPVYLQAEEWAHADVIVMGPSTVDQFAALPMRDQRGFDRAIISVDHDDNLKEVCDRLKEEGHSHFAIGLFLQTARKNALLIGFTMDFVALVALTVACIGIANTMFTAVLERSKEIGILKSVGVKDRHVLAIFLIEGAMIGVIGGCLGVLLAWGCSFPGDSVALGIIRQQEPNMPQPSTVFRFPWWLLTGAPILATTMTTVAGLLPARRAARLEPVVALRSE